MTPLAKLDPDVLEQLSVLQRLVARLVFEREKLSRNRSFEAFDDPDVLRAVRVARHLRSIVRDLLDTTTVVRSSLDDRRPGELRLAIEHPIRGVRRTAWLSAEELAILRLDPELVERLRAAAQ